MMRAIQILSLFLLLTFASVVSAQTPVTCGIVEIDGPSSYGDINFETRRRV
ncbi:MAG TPA: hypothetical protein VJR02_23410 [Pyrinomonadaceae bacterium]|nr:hypothetical protein [Pyrinomonadaceae bacterium]